MFWRFTPLCVLPLCLFAAPASSTLPARPVLFEEDRGRFIARESGVEAQFETAHVDFRLGGAKVRMELKGGARKVAPQSEGDPEGRVNYLIGPSSRWRRSARAYRSVRYEGVYSGIDLVYHGRSKRLEYDFVVAPQANPLNIAVQWSGTRAVRIGEDGSLVLVAGGAELRWEAPTIYQEIGGKRHTVEGGYRLLGGNRIGFHIGTYDSSRTLVIDPAVGFTASLRGSGDEAARGTAVDSAGNVYIAGYTSSRDLPITAGVAQSSYAGGNVAFLPGDIYVAKYSSSGSLIFLTYLGGSGDDVGFGVAVDAQGSAYVTGYTVSRDFPVTSAAYQSRYAGASGQSFGLTGGDVFVTKLSPDGRTLVYSTFLGGAQDDAGLSIAVDSAGAAYITGATVSSAFPVTANAPQSRNSGAGGQVTFPLFGSKALIAGDAFITKLNPAGSALVYSTFLGGSNDDAAWSVAVDTAGNAYIGGFTLSSNFPVTSNAFQTRFGGYDFINNPFLNFGDGFVAKLNAAGSSIEYATFVGGNGDDWVSAVAVDSSGAVSAAGSTTSPNFPTTSGAFQTSFRPSGFALLVDVIFGDAFVLKLNPAGSSLVFSTYFGGSGNDLATGITVDSAGTIVAAGSTNSIDFPVTNDAVQRTLGGNAYGQAPAGANGFGDAFLAVFSPSGARVHATYAGTGTDELVLGFALTSNGTAYLSGMTGSPKILPNGQGADALLLSVTGVSGSASSGPTIDSVVSNTGQRAVIAPNTWIELKGRNLAPRERLWGGSDFVNNQMPTELDGVSVTVNGRPAFVYYISDKQVNVLTPLDTTAVASVSVQLKNASGTSAPVTVPMQSVAPGFFQFGGTPFVAATHANGALLAPATLYPGFSTPAQPGEVVILYGSGFGQPSTPLVNGSATQTGSLPNAPEIRIGGAAAQVSFAGVISPGLYQFNVTVPTNLTDGDHPVTATYGGFSTQPGATITVRR